MHSEIPPAAPWLPILVIHIRSQVKRRQSQSYKFKKLPKIQNLKFGNKLYKQHIFWSCLIRCINMKWIQPEPQALQSGHRMRDKWTDGQTDGVKSIYPPTTSLCRGYNKANECALLLKRNRLFELYRVFCITNVNECEYPPFNKVWICVNIPYTKYISIQDKKSYNTWSCLYLVFIQDLWRAMEMTTSELIWWKNP